MAGVPPQSRSPAAQNKLLEAVTLQRNGELDAAAKAATKAVNATPNDFEALHLLGVIEAQRGNAKQAVVVLERALRLDPADATLLMNYGNALFDLGRYEDALAAHTKAARFQPANVGVQYNRAVA